MPKGATQQHFQGGNCLQTRESLANIFSQGPPTPNDLSPTNPTPPGIKEPPSDISNGKIAHNQGNPCTNTATHNSPIPVILSPPILDPPDPKKLPSVNPHTKTQPNRGIPAQIFLSSLPRPPKPLPHPTLPHKSQRSPPVILPSEKIWAGIPLFGCVFV